MYTGESKRTLKVRLTEHKRAVVRNDVNNGIAVHVAKNEHNIDWGNTGSGEVSEGILGKESH